MRIPKQFKQVPSIKAGDRVIWNSASGPRRGTVKEIDTSAPPGSGGWSHLAVMVFDDEPDKELYVNAFECELDCS